jgi:hypothetical protein
VLLCYFLRLVRETFKPIQSNRYIALYILAFTTLLDGRRLDNRLYTPICISRMRSSVGYIVLSHTVITRTGIVYSLEHIHIHIHILVIFVGPLHVGRCCINVIWGYFYIVGHSFNTAILGNFCAFPTMGFPAPLLRRIGQIDVNSPTRRSLLTSQRDEQPINA